MWPGIKSLSSEEFKQYDIAVIYARQVDERWVPVAVGKMLTGKVPVELKGKAVQVEHYLYDELWNMGTKKIPQEITIAKKDVLQEEEKEEEEEDKVSEETK